MKMAFSSWNKFLCAKEPITNFYRNEKKNDFDIPFPLYIVLTLLF